MLPSIYILEKNWLIKKIISKCIYFCDKLNYFDEYNLLDSRQRLSLFLFSIKENPILNIEEFNLLGYEGLAEAYFINGLKKKDIQSFLDSIEYYKKTNNKEIESKISYAYYEIACLYYSEKNYKLTKENLIKAKTYYNNDSFIRDKINIEFAKIIEEETHDKEKYESYLNNVIKNGENLHLVNEANKLKEEFNKKLDPDIVMLNSNPFIKKENDSSSLHSIYSYHNNQYHILQKISNKLKTNIKIKSKVLNEEHLYEAFNEKGKILIIQSDGFNEEGEIILESNNGKGESLSKIKLEKKIPKRIKYEVLILCFIKSEKLLDLFESKVKYLIAFKDINCKNLNSDTLLKYNKISIDFLIHFIRNSTEFNIEKAFKESENSFISQLEKSNINFLNVNDHIILKPNKRDKNIDPKNTIYDGKKLDKDEGKGLLLYSLLDFHININDCRNNNYTDYILKIIEFILSGKQIINIYSKNDTQEEIGESKKKMSIKTIISIEVVKFLYRHQKFNGKLFYLFNPRTYGYSLKEITYNLIGVKKAKINSKEKTEIIGKINSAFIVINNYEKRSKYQGSDNYFFYDIPENFQYLIISKKPIDNVFTYEIVIKGSDNSKKKRTNKKKHKKDKMKKIKSKNKINNSDFSSEDINPHSDFNNDISNLSKGEIESQNKDDNENIKSRYDNTSEESGENLSDLDEMNYDC